MLALFESYRTGEYHYPEEFEPKPRKRGRKKKT